MPLGTIDRTPPPFFKQGPSALSKLLMLGALAVFLMVGDARFQWVKPIRAAVATVLYPLQWVAMQPVNAMHSLGAWLEIAQAVDDQAKVVEYTLLQQAQRAALIEQLSLENQQLRQLLDMKAQVPTRTIGAEVRYESPSAGRNKIIINVGLDRGVQLGSPVLDGKGILGQVTAVYPLSAEVTLITDSEQLTPVLNTRTGLRAVAQGLGDDGPGVIAIRYISKPDDMRVGDVLTTSGLDGVYPPGLAVATVSSADDKTTQGGFFRILAAPKAQPNHALKVLVLTPFDSEPEGTRP